MVKKIRIRGYKKEDGTEVRGHLTPDKGEKGHYKGEKWFEPKRPLNWEKSDHQEKRIRMAIASRPKNMTPHNRVLSASRALQSLINVTTDKETERLAAHDAKVLRRRL